MKKFTYLITLLLLILVSFGCDRQLNQVSTETAPSDDGGSNNDEIVTDNTDPKSGGSTDSSDSSATGDSCYETGVGENSNNYITISPIIGKGSSSSNTVQWSSKDDPNFQGAGDQEIFLTDSRLNIRVLAFSSPGQGETTSTNQDCQMLPIDYKKLQVKVGVKVEGAYGYQETYVFDDIPVDGCSEVHEFTITQSSSPLIIEILDVKWDYSCTYAVSVNDSNSDNYCPFSYVWEPDCFSVGLQIATDHTKDIPR